jgi:hypothetical protein
MAFGDFTVVRAGTKWVLNSSGVLSEVANNVPAFEFNTDGTYRGLLVEPAGTNTLLRSAEFDTGAIWTPTESTVTANATTSPNGTATADKLLTNTNSAEHSLLQSSLSFTSGTAYTVSVWMKAGEIGFGFINFSSASHGSVLRNIVNLSTGAVSLGAGVTGDATEFPNGWYRFRVTATATATTGASNIRIGLTDSISSTTSTGANATDGIFIWGAQLETGSVATSYIPTVASTANRVADSVTLTGASSLIGQTEGTLYAEVTTRLVGSNRRFLDLATDVNNTRVTLQKGGGNDTFQLAVIDGGVSQALISGSAGASGTFKIAGAYKADDFVLYINGVQIGTDASGTVPPLATVGLGCSITGGAQCNDHIRSAALFPTRLSNAQLQALTS